MREVEVTQAPVDSNADVTSCLRPVEENGLIVWTISTVDVGFAAAWNRNHPTGRLKKGDRLVEVDGRPATREGIFAIAGSSAVTHTLLFKRACPNDQQYAVLVNVAERVQQEWLEEQLGKPDDNEQQWLDRQLEQEHTERQQEFEEFWAWQERQSEVQEMEKQMEASGEQARDAPFADAWEEDNDEDYTGRNESQIVVRDEDGGEVEEAAAWWAAAEAAYGRSRRHHRVAGHLRDFVFFKKK